MTLTKENMASNWKTKGRVFNLDENIQKYFIKVKQMHAISTVIQK